MPTFGREQRGGALWPVILCGMSGVAVFNLAPLYLAASAQRFSLDDRQVGWLMSAEIAGIALASLSVLLLFGRVSMRRIAIVGALCLTLGNLATLKAGSFGVFLTMRLAIGFFGDGLLYVAAIVLLGRFSDPVRAFAVLSFTNMCFTACMLWLLPQLAGEVDNERLVMVFGILGLAVILVSHRLAHHAPSTRIEGGPFRAVWGLIPVLGLVGYAFFGANLEAVWSYAERLAATIGLGTMQATLLLSLSIFFQAMGSLLAVLTSRRVAPRSALLVVVVAQSLAAVMLALAGDTGLYLAAYSLWGASWNFGAAHLLGMLARLPDGQRALSLAPGTEALGVAAGPLGVSILLSPGLEVGLQVALPTFAMSCVAVTAISFLALGRRIGFGAPITVSSTCGQRGSEK